MELKPNMYVRTDKGQIGKIVKIEKGYKEKLIYFFDIDLPNYAHIEEEFIKASYNIIDLIEVGDYVNSELVLGKVLYGNNAGVKVFGDIYYKEDIKSIVTKEQFESMQYEIN